MPSSPPLATIPQIPTPTLAASAPSHLFLALSCPHPSSIPLTSVLSVHLCRCLHSKPDWCPPPGCCWEGFVGGVQCDYSIFLAILIPHYPSTAVFKNLCLDPFQAASLLSKLGMCGLWMPYEQLALLMQCRQLSKIVPCLGSTCLKSLTTVLQWSLFYRTHSRVHGCHLSILIFKPKKSRSITQTWSSLLLQFWFRRSKQFEAGFKLWIPLLCTVRTHFNSASCDGKITLVIETH